MTAELRCGYKLHGIIVESGAVEVRCDSRFCGSERGVVVLHRFDLVTGELLETLKYKNPRQPQQEG